MVRGGRFLDATTAIDHALPPVARLAVALDPSLKLAPPIVDDVTRAVKELEKDPTPYIHYFIAETGGLLEPHEFQTWRLLHAPPQPYTRERFDDTYNWTVKWNMTVPGATFENTVDNRAWE